MGDTLDLTGILKQDREMLRVLAARMRKLAERDRRKLGSETACNRTAGE